MLSTFLHLNDSWSSQDACETLVPSQETPSRAQKWEPLMELQKPGETLGQGCITKICCCSLWFPALHVGHLHLQVPFTDILQVLFCHYLLPLIAPAEVVLLLYYSSPLEGGWVYLELLSPEHQDHSGSISLEFPKL